MQPKKISAEKSAPKKRKKAKSKKGTAPCIDDDSMVAYIALVKISHSVDLT